MLKFRRIEAGRYQADSDTRRYVVAKYGRGWLLTSWLLTETVGVKHTITQTIEATAEADTKALAAEIARRHDQLVRDGYGRLFTDLKPMTRATIDAYEAETSEEK